MTDKHIQTHDPSAKSFTGLQAIFAETSHRNTTTVLTRPLGVFFERKPSVKPKDMLFVRKGKANEFVGVTLKTGM